MKSKILFLVVICLFAASFVQAQATIYPITGGGIITTPGEKSEGSIIVGGNFPMFTDKNTGLMVYDRLQYYYSNRIGSDDGKGAMTFLCVRRNLNFISSYFANFHIDIGGGMAMGIADAGTDKYGITKFEFGVDIYKSVGIAFATDFQMGVNGGKNVWFPHLLIDLSPGLDKIK